MQEGFTTRRSKPSNKIWRAHLNAWQKSGLNRAEYCRRHNLSYHALRYWEKKCERQGFSNVTLVPVPLAKTAQNNIDREGASALKVEIGNRFRIEVGDDFSTVTLARLISTLEGC